MDALIGSYELKLDSKMRLGLPLPLRLAMRVQTENDLMLMAGPDGCIVGMGTEEFSERYQPRLNSLDYFQKADRFLLRSMGGRAFRVRIDTENRICLNAVLTDLAGLDAGDSAMVVGMIQHFEIWAKPRLEAYMKQDASFEDQLENRFGGAGPETT